jgi:hypothetical protein
MLAASNFEFKQRFAIIGVIFGLAFATYGLDRQAAGAVAAEWIVRLRHTVATATDYRLMFALAGLLCVLAALIRTWATAYLNPEAGMNRCDWPSSRIPAPAECSRSTQGLRT